MSTSTDRPLGASAEWKRQQPRHHESLNGQVVSRGRPHTWNHTKRCPKLRPTFRTGMPSLVLMGRLLVLRHMVLAACGTSTSVTTSGSLDPGQTTTLADASTTDPPPEATSPGPSGENTASIPPSASFEDIAGAYRVIDPGGVGFFFGSWTMGPCTGRLARMVRRSCSTPGSRGQVSW